jgi:hypothetical protein
LTPAKAAKHDPRLVELVRAMARQTAQEDHDAEQKRQAEAA